MRQGPNRQSGNMVFINETRSHLLTLGGFLRSLKSCICVFSTKWHVLRVYDFDIGTFDRWCMCCGC